MLKRFSVALFSVFTLLTSTQAQDATTKDTSYWKIGGGTGIDFSQLLLINPKVGAGENRIGIGGNTNFYAHYNKGRLSWKNTANINFAVQKLGRSSERPFQKSLDEFRVSSIALYNLTKDDPFAYALDMLFLSQLTPTFQGNILSRPDSGYQRPIAKLLSPATITISPGFAYKPNDKLSVMVSPASLKLITVADDSIARLSNAAQTNSLHGNPLGRFASEEAFRQSYHVRPTGKINDSTYYANTFLNLGATLKAMYQNKFLKDKDGKARLGVTTSLTLYSNYLRNPQNIDVEWLTQTDLYIIKGLSVTLTTNLFYDHDVLVQYDRDKNINTGVNGYESTARRVSFTQTLLIKYNFLF